MNYSVFSALFPLKLRILFEECILGTLEHKDVVPPIYSYRIAIDKNPIQLQQISALSYLCLLLTKVLFETSFKSFQYNTEGRRLSNYSIKLIWCSHYRSRCKGLCQNKKHEFDQYAKGGHFCAAHMALSCDNDFRWRICIQFTLQHIHCTYSDHGSITWHVYACLHKMCTYFHQTAICLVHYLYLFISCTFVIYLDHCYDAYSGHWAVFHNYTLICKYITDR